VISAGMTHPSSLGVAQEYNHHNPVEKQKSMHVYR